MKKYIYTLVLFPILIFGQTQTENYVKTTTYKVQTSQVELPTLNDVLTNITYYDGLGRPIQKIANRQSGLGNDIIVPFGYDKFGRQVKEYLPFARQINSLNYDANAILDFPSGANSNQEAYYQSQDHNVTGNYSFDTTTYPYSEKEFEKSPLNRVLKQAAPGDAWRLGAGHEIKMDYQTNVLNEVRKFKVVFSNASTTENHDLFFDGFYAENELFKTITKDENWQISDNLNKTTQEFKNREGQVVLKRTFNNGSPHNTYYVYDIYGNLSYVIPPTASDEIDIQFSAVAPVSNRNFPWTALASVNDELATSYNKLFKEYENEFIRNNDLFNKYGGQGGFTISRNSNEELVLSINLTTVDPMELRIGSIASLKDLGEFKDAEIGRITGPEYEYIFTIKDNMLVVNGKGKLTAVNVTFNGTTKLVYNTNYPWSELVDIDSNEAYEFSSRFSEITNANILTTNIPNSYGAMGGVNVSIDENDQVSLNLNMTTTTIMTLKKGIVVSLKTERKIADRDFGTITSEGYKYNISIKENSIYIEGEGGFTTLNFTSGVNTPPTSNIVLTNTLQGLCYIYHYDYRNRIVEKKIPGKGWEYIVYDKLDRPIYTQDAKGRLDNNWLFTRYDKFNRVVYTGQFKFVSVNTNSAMRIDLQNISNANFLTVDEHRNNPAFSNNGININYTKYWETTFTAPNTWFSNVKVFTVNYYDDFEFTPYTTLISQTLIGFVTAYSQRIDPNPKGLQTGSLVNVLDSTDWIMNITGYNDRMRPIWTSSKNAYLQTDDEVHSNFDVMSGKVLSTTTIHNKTNVTTNLTTVDNFEYDRADRLVKHTQTINGGFDQLITFNVYDELGQLIQKRVGGLAPQNNWETGTTALQNINYAYNIRGWLLNINEPDNPLTGTNNLFAFRIKYDRYTFGNALFNGNIALTTWRTMSDDRHRTYSYYYDDLNRLTQANYFGQYPLYNNNLALQDYTEGNITYDKNGNITHLVRYGLKSTGNTIDKIDDLTYSYQATSNKLLTVTDNADSKGFRDVNTAGTDDYKYDINGNMTADLNKHITSITYNHLNLPTVILFGSIQNINGEENKNINSGGIIYVYDANGIKLSKSITTNPIGQSSPKTLYDGMYQYENNVLQFFSHPEGYVENENGTYSYVYQFKDHLGNIRLSYKQNPQTSALEIVKENNYYPFGLKQQGYNNVENSIGNAAAEKYKYNGKELQDELGLNVYDYGARLYDPAAPHFLQMDPKAETSRRFSPYTYCLNNPVFFIDPDGMQAVENDDWIVHQNSQGETAVTYHQGVETKEQAAAAGYTGVSDVFKSGTISGTAPDGSGYSYQLNANATVTNSQGQTTDQGFSTPNGTWVAENPIARANMAINGAVNVIMGTVGFAGSAAVTGTGVGAVAGVAGMTLSTGEIGIGIGQIANSFQTNVDADLQNFNTLPGLGAARSGNPNAAFIDGVGAFAPGMMAPGGNTGSFLDALMPNAKPSTVLGGVDAYMDGKSLWDGATKK